jgi:hypothetical protein
VLWCQPVLVQPRLALVKDRVGRRAVGEDVRVPWSYKNLCSAFAPLKDEVCPWRSEVVVGSMQAGLEQLGRALQHHSSRRLRQAGTEDLGQVGEDGSHREFGVIGVETLAVKNMLANRRLARHISDVGWGTILAELNYKTSWSDGSVIVAADRFHPSSKTCSACGAVKAELSRWRARSPRSDAT